MMSLPANDALFTESALRLGEVHWHLLKAATALGELTVKQEKAEGSPFSQSMLTEFGKEVGRDEINWWIVRKESNLLEFQERSERALAAAEVLKARARELRTRHPACYDDIVESLRVFVEGCGQEVVILHEYVKWLESKDALAPSMLFTYRVWGSTKRGDRWIDLTADSVQQEGRDTLRRLTEIVLGLATRSGSTYDAVACEMSVEIYEANPERTGEIRIDANEHARRTGMRVFAECADYFGEVRDSLRHIVGDIQKYYEQRDLLHSHSFWRSFVAKAMHMATETMLWDFKESLPMWHATGNAREGAKVTFAEDVASFANADGGVLIVGVTDRQPRQVVGVGDSREVESRLKVCADVLAKLLDSERKIDTWLAVPIATAGVTRTCLVVAVAQAADAVGVRAPDGRFSFPVRRETGITRVSRLDLLGRHIKADNHDFLARLVAVVDGK